MADINLGRLRAATPRTNLLLRTMANEERLKILGHLADGEKSASELTPYRPAVIRCLAAPCLAGHDRIVRTRCGAQTVCYSIAFEPVQAIPATLRELFSP